MRFDLTAVDGGNRVIALDLEASDEAAARDTARQGGYAVLTLERKNALLSNPFARQAEFPTALFSIELLALLEAGLNAVEALQTLAAKEPSGENRRVLSALLEALYRGESISQAVAHFPRAFPPLFAATVRSSERTGNLQQALSRYIAFEEQLDKVRKKVLAALIYPAILLAVGTLVILFLLFYVVPRFARVYEDASAELPLFSSLMVALSRWIEQHGLATAVFAGSVLAVLAYSLSRQDIRAKILAQCWRVPALGKRMMIYQLARFYRTTGMLLMAGIPAHKAFAMVGGVLAPNLRAQLARATALLTEGRSISGALTAVGLATPVATGMMSVGERSGRMGELLDRIARFYDDETARFVDAFTRVFEPLLMTALGLAVGFVVVMMYMPIFELAGSVR
jgi:general secretion pathway protein F